MKNKEKKKDHLCESTARETDPRCIQSQDGSHPEAMGSVYLDEMLSNNSDSMAEELDYDKIKGIKQ